MPLNYKIAVVIPSYKVKKHIFQVLNAIDSSVKKIYVVDDACPEKTGDFVLSKCIDKRVVVLKNNTNQGVGGAVMAGYKEAMKDNMDIIVKIDGDNQMDPKLLIKFISPILNGNADFTKGNRFYNVEDLKNMPIIRIFGNSALSFLSKLSTGYWDIFDPNNGYTAIHCNILKKLNLNKISKSFFFESDMLFRLNLLRAKVQDIPMVGKYDNEISNLKIHTILVEFIYKHSRNFSKRILYNYFIRDMSPASFELIAGFIFLSFGITFGIIEWAKFHSLGLRTPSGTVMVAITPILLGIQLLLSFLNFDINSTPKHAQYNQI